jgi:hypothetical protein
MVSSMKISWPTPQTIWLAIVCALVGFIAGRWAGHWLVHWLIPIT